MGGSDLKAIVLHSLNYAYMKGDFSSSLRTCIISCIPKGDKSREYLKISLLSVPYKIFFLAVAYQLKKIIDILLAKNSFKFYQWEIYSTRLIYDMLHHFKSKDILTRLLKLIKFEKGFDSVSW